MASTAGNPPSSPSSSASSGRGNFFTDKLGPLPTWVWLLIITAAAVAYYLYSKYKSSKNAKTAQQQQGGGGSGTPGVVVENQFGPYPTGDEGGGGGKKHEHPPKEPDQRQITLNKNETLGELAKQRHWSTRTLHAVEQENITQGQGRWKPSTELHKGEEVERPLG